MGGFELIKFRGVFGEPALYSSFQVLSLTLIYFKAKEVFYKNINFVLIIIISLFLTSSLTSIALLSVLFFLFYSKKEVLIWVSLVQKLLLYYLQQL